MRNTITALAWSKMRSAGNPEDSRIGTRIVTSDKLHAPIVQRLEAKLRTTPVATLVVVPDLRIGLVAIPVRYLTILPGLPRQFLLHHESFVSRLWVKTACVNDKDIAWIEC